MEVRCLEVMLPDRRTSLGNGGEHNRSAEAEMMPPTGVAAEAEGWAVCGRCTVGA